MRTALVLMLVMMSLVAVPASASADPINVGDTIRFADGPGTTGGGEFIVTVNNLHSFITFCLQRTESVNYSTNFVIGGISTYTLTDPVNKGGNALGQDELSPQTAWLYTQFRNGSLAGYDFLGGGRVASANHLQNAFWWFEGELTSNPNNLFVTAANQAVLNGWTGLGDVRVLNLYFPNGTEAQDQLVLLDPRAHSVPEPATLALLACGAGGVLLRARRRRGRSRSV